MTLDLTPHVLPLFAALTVARYAEFVVRRTSLVLVVSLLVVATVGLGVRHLVVRFDPEAAFPADDPAVELDRAIRAEFGGRNLVVIAIAPRAGDVWQPAVLHATRDITLAVRLLPGAMDKGLVSLAAPSMRAVEVTDDGIEEHYLMRDVPEAPEAIAALRERVLVPLVIAIAVTTGILAWGGIPFDLVTASIVAIAVGIGADYAIYVLYR